MIKFGTGGWRAVIADGFTKENLRLLTAGLCLQLEREGTPPGAEVCVGYDRRFLSRESAQWASEVLAGYGYRVCLVNRSSPTPLIMYTVKTRGLPCGMMITASHNPAVYNGVKLFTAGGRDADAAFTGRLEEIIAGLTPPEVKSRPYAEALAAGQIHEENPANEYIDSILSMVDTEKIKHARLKIAVDPMYGVSKTILSTILITCRCDVETIHDRHDALFGGKLPAPNAVTMLPLSRFVLDNGCDLGVATDGDADRLGVVDENGEFVHPNTLLTLLYYYLVKYRGWKGPCVRNNSTTHLLDRVAEGLGQRCHETPVGFKYISAKMAETDAVIGGESSGGLTVRGHIAGKDGIYAAALLTEMLSVTGKSISALYREITEHYGVLCYREEDFPMTPERKEELRRLLFDVKTVPALDRDLLRVSREDGVKLYFKDGTWVICRFSGTEPLLRMAAEAETEAVAQGYIDAWRDLLGLPGGQ